MKYYGRSSSEINYNLEEKFRGHVIWGEEQLLKLKKLNFYIESGIKLTRNGNRLLDNKILETLER